MDPNFMFHAGRIRQQELLDAAARRGYAVPPWERLAPFIRFVFNRVRAVVLFIRQQAASNGRTETGPDLQRRVKRLQQPLSRR